MGQTCLMPTTDIRNSPSGKLKPAGAGGGIEPPAGQIDGTAADPLIVGLTESGGAELAIGVVADGEFLKRDGLEIVGAPAASTSDEVSNESDVTGATVTEALNNLLTALGLAGLKLAPLLTDVSSTLSLTAGSLFVLPAATLTANRVFTIDRNGLPTNTPGTQSLLYFLCLDTTAFTKTITNGGAGGGNPMVVAISTAAQLYCFIDDGANWSLVSQVQVQAA